MQSSPLSNRFEVEARREKVSKLVETIDAIARFRGIDPVANALEVANLISFFDVQSWENIAHIAHVNFPREKSQAAVRDVYFERDRLERSVARSA